MDYLLYLQSIRENLPAFVNMIFVIISEFAINAGPVIAVLVYLIVDKRQGSFILFNFACADYLANFSKLWVCRYRPWVKDSRLHIAKEASSTATGYSFPSAHTTCATSIYGSVAKWRKGNKKLVIILMIMIVLTAFARNWLGAHFLSDVIVAIIISTVVIFLNEFLYNRFSKIKNIDLIIAIGMIFVLIISLIIASIKSYPMNVDANGELLADPQRMIKDFYASAGMSTGWAIAWLLDKRVIRYEIPESKKDKIVIGLICVVLFGFSYFVIGQVWKLFFGLWAAAFLKRFFTVVVVLILIPIGVNIYDIRVKSHSPRHARM